VRGLDFTCDDDGDVLLASSSQDSFIRIWRISQKPIATTADNDDDNNLIQVEERTFKVAEMTFILSLESVLQGHENWVYSVNWSRNNGSLQLLSSSMDKTMIVWSIDKEQELWTEKIRVGDVGGNSLGFYGARFNANGKSIIGHGFLGSLHLWKENQIDSKLWEPGVINGGHFKEARDLGWEPKGEFLFSISADQTTRIHAGWKRDKEPRTFHEIARPQVHGYDMQCLAVLSRYKFASAAEEKIVRTFQAPGNFVENFRTLVCPADEDLEGEDILRTHQKGASVPSLGLSNKAVYEEDLINPKVDEKKFKDEYPENYFVPLIMKTPPTEEYLTQNTLWPELQKLYAHGYELYSLAATKNGKILASACKATTVEHSEIILWNTSTWKILQRLRSHKLTVTQMKFSNEGNRLLSVSRDRRWTMFEKKKSTENDDIDDEEEEVNFEVVASTDRQNGVHERIIWCCGWTHDDQFFATGSRDGKVAVWSKSTNVVVQESSSSSLREYKHVASLNLPQESITSLAFSTMHHNNSAGSYLLAIGFESGIIQLHSFDGSSSCFSLMKSLDHSEAHHLCVNKLEFRPNCKEIQLASCGNDHLVRIYDIVP
jgi:elongator complex protein 2